MNAIKIKVGTRGSDLALVQAATAERKLALAFPELLVRRQVIRTTGDRRTDVALKDVAKAEGTDKGVFTKELEIALAAGEIDLAVHSLKDVPTVLDEGFEMVGTLARAPIRDLLVMKTPGGIGALPTGAVVGTSSVRRARQLEWLRPDLEIVDIRGNVPTRVIKLTTEKFDAVMLAEAGLLRLGYPIGGSRVINGETLYFEPLGETEFYPAAGQGAIGLEIRTDDAAMRARIHAISDRETFIRTQAEREFLRLLDAGCHTPVGVFSKIVDGVILMSARVFPEQGGDPQISDASDRDSIEVAAKLHAGLHLSVENLSENL